MKLLLLVALFAAAELANGVPPVKFELPAELHSSNTTCNNPGGSVPSPYDSCNTCSCSESGFIGACTEKGCIEDDSPCCFTYGFGARAIPCCFNTIPCEEHDKLVEEQEENGPLLGGAMGKHHFCPRDAAHAHQLLSEPLDDHCLDCGIRMCPSGDRAICCPETNSCECPEDCGAEATGPACGSTQCEFGEECCLTCDDQGKLIPSNTCAPLCAQPLCIAPPKECSEFCTLDYTPVCGTDGKTYSNLCHLEGKACTDASNLAVAYQGECNPAGEQGTKCDNPGQSIPSPFDACNTCRCGDSGLVEGCTRRLCLDEIIDDRNTTCDNPGGSVPSPYDSCNTCSCTESGFIGICTEIGCIEENPCCFRYGFGQFQVPCCFEKISCEEHDRLLEEQKEHGPPPGGAMGKHHFCPRDAAHAHQLLSEKEEEVEKKEPNNNPYDKLLYCKDNDPNYCEENTDGEFNFCHPLPQPSCFVDGLEVKNCYGICIPEDESCDENKPCQSIGSEHSGLLSSKCENGKCVFAGAIIIA